MREELRAHLEARVDRDRDQLAANLELARARQQARQWRDESVYWRDKAADERFKRISLWRTVLELVRAAETRGDHVTNEALLRALRNHQGER